MKTLTLFFFSLSALASPCEKWTGFTENYSICWNDEMSGYVSQKGEALTFLKAHHQKPFLNIVDGKNPASVVCSSFKLPVIVLEDAKNNQQSFCQFSDGTIADSNAVERSLR